MPVKVVKTANDLDDLIEQYSKIIIKFTSDWCGPCKRIAPVFKNHSENHMDILFIEIDIDTIEEYVVKKYRVSRLPTFLGIKNGMSLDSAKVEGTSQDGLLKLINYIVEYKT
jgi:thioredoxin 1